MAVIFMECIYKEQDGKVKGIFLIGHNPNNYIQMFLYYY